MKSKFVFLKLETRDGEREYSHESIHELPKDANIDEWAEDYLRDFWMGGSQKLEDGKYEFHGGETITELHSVREIPKEHYDILKQYL